MITTPTAPVTADGIQRCVYTLTRAFEADPIARWVFPDPAGYAAGFAGMVQAFARIACAQETAWQAADFAGTAVWLPPGTEPDEEALRRALEQGTDAAHRPAALGLLEQMNARHPREPHWYLPFLGVLPHLQGRGYGSALLADAARTCDRAGLPAYLEATSPANVALYRRHGFLEVGEIRVEGSPPLVPMRREPRCIRRPGPRPVPRHPAERRTTLRQSVGV